MQQKRKGRIVKPKSATDGMSDMEKQEFFARAGRRQRLKEEIEYEYIHRDRLKMPPGEDVI